MIKMKRKKLNEFLEPALVVDDVIKIVLDKEKIHYMVVNPAHMVGVEVQIDIDEFDEYIPSEEPMIINGKYISKILRATRNISESSDRVELYTKKDKLIMNIENYRYTYNSKIETPPEEDVIRTSRPPLDDVSRVTVNLDNSILIGFLKPTANPFMEPEVISFEVSKDRELSVLAERIFFGGRCVEQKMKITEVDFMNVPSDIELPITFSFSYEYFLSVFKNIPECNITMRLRRNYPMNVEYSYGDVPKIDVDYLLAPVTDEEMNKGE